MADETEHRQHEMDALMAASMGEEQEEQQDEVSLKLHEHEHLCLFTHVRQLYAYTNVRTSFLCFCLCSTRQDDDGWYQSVTERIEQLSSLSGHYKPVITGITTLHVRHQAPL